MAVEDGIQKATKNLDQAADAAPTSKVVHATDQDEQHPEHRNENEEVKQNETEDAQDKSED